MMTEINELFSRQKADESLFPYIRRNSLHVRFPSKLQASHWLAPKKKTAT
jgi:hypothetical protein